MEIDDPYAHAHTVTSATFGAVGTVLSEYEGQLCPCVVLSIGDTEKAVRVVLRADIAKEFARQIAHASYISKDDYYASTGSRWEAPEVE